MHTPVHTVNGACAVIQLHVVGIKCLQLLCCVYSCFDYNCSTYTAYALHLLIVPLLLAYHRSFYHHGTPSLTGRTATVDITTLETSANIYYHQGLSLSTQ